MYFDSQMPLLDLDFAERYQPFVGIDTQGIVVGRIELDHGAAPHAQQVMDGQHGRAELNADFDFDLVERVHGSYLEKRLAKVGKGMTNASPNMVSERLTQGEVSRERTPNRLLRADNAAIAWQVFEGLSPYPQALAAMKRRAAEIAAGTADEAIFVVEHPPLYTSGTSARPADLLEPDRFPIFEAGRGGQYTYHGPGQRIAYTMIDLRARGRDVRAFVANLEQVVIDTLAAFDVVGERRQDRIGVWVRRPERGADAEDKIAAIGVRIGKWVSTHGLSLNVAPDLSHYGGIVPCGITDHGVTSLKDLGKSVSMAEVDGALKSAFIGRFGPFETVNSSSFIGS
jgi:lipoyl(octanoyl) transferase